MKKVDKAGKILELSGVLTILSNFKKKVIDKKISMTEAEKGRELNEEEITRIKDEIERKFDVYAGNAARMAAQTFSAEHLDENLRYYDSEAYREYRIVHRQAFGMVKDFFDDCGVSFGCGSKSSCEDGRQKDCGGCSQPDDKEKKRK